MTATSYYRFEVVSILRKYPALFHPLIKLNNRTQGLSWPAFLEKDTEFVIEGYFRSGNTFAARAFMVAQQRPVKLAFHTHAIATVISAARRNLPSLILLRNPADTVTSSTFKAPGTTMRQHLHWYIRFYEKVYELRNSLYIALFDEVVQDFGQVIRGVNKRFHTQFLPFANTPENVKNVFSWIEAIDRELYKNDIARYSVPLKAKEGLKDSLKNKLTREDPALLKQADDLYQAIANNRHCG